MTRPVRKFGVRDSCPRCREPLRLVAVRPLSDLLRRSHVLVCPSQKCGYSSAVDPQTVSARWRAAVNG